MVMMMVIRAGVISNDSVGQDDDDDTCGSVGNASMVLMM